MPAVYYHFVGIHEGSFDETPSLCVLTTLSHTCAVRAGTTAPYKRIDVPRNSAFTINQKCSLRSSHIVTFLIQFKKFLPDQQNFNKRKYFSDAWRG